MSVSSVVSYGQLKTLVNTANKTGLNKSFGVIERKIQKEYQQQNKDEIKYLKQLIRKVTTNKSVDLSIILNADNMTKEEKLNVLNGLLKEKQQFSIPHNFTIQVGHLSKTLQKLINPISSGRRVRVKGPSSTPSKKKPEINKNLMKKIRQEDQRDKDILAKQVLSIEPMDFFVLLPFYTLNPEQANILSNILDLDENMMPNKYTIFETFNTIVEKKHLTGEYFEYNVQQSDISKKFMEMEPELRQVLFDFTKLNKRAIKKARDEMLELVAVVQILHDFNPKNYSSLAPTVIKNVVRIYSNLIKNSKDNASIVKYLVRSIELLERRRQRMHAELPQLIKDDDKRKFLTKETASLIANQNTIRGQLNENVQPQDAELGEHYDDRFEEDEGFDDFDIVEEDDSMLLG